MSKAVARHRRSYSFLNPFLLLLRLVSWTMLVHQITRIAVDTLLLLFLQFVVNTLLLQPYLLLRSMFSPRGRSEAVLLKSFQKANSYEEWLAKAEVVAAWPDLDALIEFNCAASVHFEALERFNVELAHALAARDSSEVMNLLLAGGMRNFCGLRNPKLFLPHCARTHSAVERYYGLVLRGLDYLESACFKLRPSELGSITDEQYGKFLSSLRITHGRTALCLSGGGTLAMFHLGILKLLIERRQLPSVISGSSGGGVIAAVLACTSDEELVALIDAGQDDLVPYFQLAPEFSKQLKNFFNTGYVIDQQIFCDALRALLKDVTFEQAFEKTGRLVSITTSQAVTERCGESLVCNVVNTPSVLLWSAVAASCSLPLIMPPSALFTLSSSCLSPVEQCEEDAEPSCGLLSFAANGNSPVAQFRSVCSDTCSESDSPANKRRSNDKENENQTAAVLRAIAERLDTDFGCVLSCTEPSQSSRSADTVQRFEFSADASAKRNPATLLMPSASLESELYEGCIASRDWNRYDYDSPGACSTETHSMRNKDAELYAFDGDVFGAHEVECHFSMIDEAEPECDSVEKMPLAHAALSGSFPLRKLRRYGPANMTFLDGSIVQDIPSRELQTTFNVRSFIVSQVNPHILPLIWYENDVFFQQSRLVALFNTVWNYIVYDFSVAYNKVVRLKSHVTLRGFDIAPFLTQKMDGHVTLTPSESWNIFQMMRNPDSKNLKEVIRKGERRTWPHMNRITYMQKIEKYLMQKIKKRKLR